LGIDVKNVNVVCVSKLRRGKGHTFLLEAFEKVFAINKKLNLLIVGDGEEKGNLFKQVEGYTSKGNIYFLGDRRDVKEILKISDIFVLATEAEGMSNAILEAMASRLPIITTDIEENRELIENGKTGILVPVKRVDVLVSSINKLINDKELRKNLGENAKKVIDKFDIKKTINMLINLYEI